MPVICRTSTSGNFSSNHTPTFSIPTLVVTTDLMVLIVFTNDTTVSAGPTGWTQQGSTISPVALGRLSVWWRNAQAGDAGGTASGFTSSGSNGFGWWAMYVAFDNNTPPFIDAMTTSLGATSNPALPANTAAQAGEILVGYVQGIYGGSALTAPGDMTSRETPSNTSISSSRSNMADRGLASNGSTPTERFSSSGSSPTQAEAQLSILIGGSPGLQIPGPGRPLNASRGFA